MSRKQIVDSSTEALELFALANDPTVTLDVTNLDLGWLLERVRAILYTTAKAFNAPRLQISGHIDAPYATSFSAPQLVTSGDISADSTRIFSAPQLQSPSRITRPGPSPSSPARPAPASPIADKRAP